MSFQLSIYSLRRIENNIYARKGEIKIIKRTKAGDHCLKSILHWFGIGLCTSQLKPPPFGSRGRVGDLTLTPVKGHQYPYPLRLEFRPNAPTPEATKVKISKFQKKTCI